MFRRLTRKDILQLLLLLLIAWLGVYFYVNTQARDAVWQKLYPLRARMALQHLSCSDSSPAWMAETLRLATHRLRAPANQIAYISPQGELHHCESGYGGLPWFSEALSASSRFRIASVTKLWTADAVLQAVQRGDLTLDTPLLAVLNDLPPMEDARFAQITIAHLLLHQGGFDRLSVFGTDMFHQGEEEICPRHLPKLADVRLNFDPGSRTSYSNLGYCLLGEVLARKTGMPYTDWMEKQYHLQADGLAFIGQAPMPDEVQYNHEEKGLMGIGNIYTAFNYGDLASAAGLSGNAVGVAKQVKAMLHDGLNITSAPAEENCDASQLRECYGYAMFAYRPERDKPQVWFRDGNLPGASSLVMVDEMGGVVVLLSNGMAGDSVTGSDAVKQFLYEQRF